MNRILLAVLTFTAAGCSHGQLAPVTVAGVPLPGALSLVPEDTSYFFTTAAPLPPELLEQWYAQSVKAMSKALPAAAKNTREGKLLKLTREFMTATALTENGLSKQPKALIYGLGALPVLRLALADAKKFDAFLLNAMAQLELTWEAKRVEGHVVRLAELDPAAKGADANPPVVMMQLYHGGDCVVSIAHPAEVGARVQAITGQVKPARSLAASPRLASLFEQDANAAMTRYGIGAFNVHRLAQVLGFEDVPASGLVSELRKEARFKESGRHAFRLIASLFGETTFVADAGASGEYAMTMRQRFAPSLEPYLDGLSVGVPGPEDFAKTAFDFSVAVRMKAAVKMFSEGIQNHLAWAKKQGYVLETAQPAKRKRPVMAPEPSTEASPKVMKPILQPMDPGKVPGALLRNHGFRLSLFSVNLENPTPMSILGSLRVALIVATEAAEDLLKLSRMNRRTASLFADLEIPPTGEPVPLKKAPIPGITVARTDKALALMFGGGVAAQVSAWLKAEPAARPPLGTMHIDSQFFASALTAMVQIADQRAEAKAKRTKRPVPESEKAMSEQLSLMAEQMKKQGPQTATTTIEENQLVMRMNGSMAVGD